VSKSISRQCSPNGVKHQAPKLRGGTTRSGFEGGTKGRGRAVFLLSLESEPQGRPFSVLSRERCGLLFTERLLFGLVFLEQRKSNPETNRGEERDARSEGIGLKMPPGSVHETANEGSDCPSKRLQRLGSATHTTLFVPSNHFREKPSQRVFHQAPRTCEEDDADQQEH
jgi:hypothetical protein